MIRALGVFALAYVLISKPRWPRLALDRTSAALIGAVLMVLTGVLSSEQAYRAVDWNTVLLLFGMFLLAGGLRLAGFFGWAAAAVLARARTPMALLAGLVFVSGILSALLVNDAVCVMLVPLVVAVLERGELPIRPYLFAIAAGANVGSVMTVVGNPQNMIIAHAAPLSYVAFARVLVPIGLVDLGVTVVLLRWIFRADLRGPLSAPCDTPRPCVDRPLLARTAACFVAVVVAFVAGGNLAWTALAGAVILLAISGRSPRTLIAEVDGPLLLFFGGLFVTVAGLDASGVLAAVSAWLIPLIDAPGLPGILNLSWVSVLGSNVVSNVPYVLMAERWIAPGVDHVWLLLALTSTLAGNLTVFGSAANVIVFESARDHAHIGFWEFLRVGVPITLVTTMAGVALLLLLM